MKNMANLFLVLFLAFVTVPSLSSAQSTATMVPLYVWPAVTNGRHSWQPLIDAKKANPCVPVWAIVNPNNGPGDAPSSAYTDAIDKLIKNKINVLAYVPTNYTQRPADEVESDIDSWLEFYPDRIRGIFFDEMSNENKDKSTKRESNYYKNLNNYAKSQPGINFTVGNPGADTTADFVPTLDTIIIYEQGKGFPSEAEYGRWHKNHPRSKWGILPYNITRGAYNRSQVQKAKKTVKFIYVTDDTLPNPWDTVSPYLTDLLKDLKD